MAGGPRKGGTLGRSLEVGLGLVRRDFQGSRNSTGKGTEARRAGHVQDPHLEHRTHISSARQKAAQASEPRSLLLLFLCIL